MLGGSWEREAVRRKLRGIMEEASWMRNRVRDIKEEASWRRAWLARGGLKPGGVSGQKMCVFEVSSQGAARARKCAFFIVFSWLM